jgi:hypothetical protein
MKKQKNDLKDLEKLFHKIENMKEFKEWFGTPCPSFNPLCFNCEFWNIWNKLKIKIFGRLKNAE